MDGQGYGLQEFRSPVRVLAASFLKSRDNWKRKCMDVKTELKRFKVRVSDVAKSRDAWKDKAETRQRELEALQAEVQELQDQLRGVHGPGAAAEKKMRRLASTA